MRSTSPNSPSPSASTHAGQAKREQVLEGAAKVFLERGYEGASMSQIAEAAHVSKGTLYNHFKNKAELFRALIERLSADHLAPMFSSVPAQNRDCLADLRALSARLIEIMIAPTTIGLYRIIVSEASKFPELSQIFWEHGPTPVKRAFVEWARERCRLGQLDIPDPEFAAEQFFTLSQTRIVQRRRFELPVDCSEAAIALIAEKTAQAFFKLYAPRP